MRCAIPLLAALAVALVAACSKDGDGEETATHTLEPLSLTIRAPGDWTFRDRGAEGLSAGSWSLGKAMTGVIIMHYPDRPAATTLEAAREQYPMSGSTIREAVALERGGFYLYYDTDFGGTLLPQVQTVFPWGEGGTVECVIQLQPGQDPAPFREVCSSIAPSGG